MTEDAYSSSAARASRAGELDHGAGQDPVAAP
jgi:hypothetical protein